MTSNNTKTNIKIMRQDSYSVIAGTFAEEPFADGRDAADASRVAVVELS